MENKFLRSTKAMAFALVLGALAPTTPALAQTGTDTGGAGTEAGDNRGGDDNDWGWIGLLGLLGLAGMVKKGHRDDLGRR